MEQQIKTATNKEQTQEEDLKKQTKNKSEKEEAIKETQPKKETEQQSEKNPKKTTAKNASKRKKTSKSSTKSKSNTTRRKKRVPCYLQNRELSWLKFNERVLDQGNNSDNPLLERLNFVSIFSSNLKEFFMVRVGSLTDLTKVKEVILDNKSGMTPRQQLNAIYKECHRLYPIQEEAFENLMDMLAVRGLRYVRNNELSQSQKKYLKKYLNQNVIPILSPQVINAQHPFPHLKNGSIYIAVRLESTETALGIIPLPSSCERIIKLPSSDQKPEGTVEYTLLEQALEFIVSDIFSMYKVKHTNIICVTRNADLDVIEGNDEIGDDYREHMKRILKKRKRLAPVRLESEKPLTGVIRTVLKKKLRLREEMFFTTSVPLDMSYTGDLKDMLTEKQIKHFTYTPFTPQWPAELNRNKSIIKQALKRDYLVQYPYESFDPMVKLVREAAFDKNVISVRITLYRLAKESRLAEALIACAEAGKSVTALFELRARFDEDNNIAWSQRFEEAGVNVLYGLENYKVHSKVCAIVRKAKDGSIQRITQFGTGNYNETTAKLYTDLCYITSNETFGLDAQEFFKNLALENISNNYRLMCVAPLQIKQLILYKIDEQIKYAQEGKPNGLFFKTNSVTDINIIRKLVKASKEGVKTTILCRGISCILPGKKKYTENLEVVSIVGRLLEHSRIYGFGDGADMQIMLSSADLMTRNMDKRVEVAWPVLDDTLRLEIINYIFTCLSDTAKLRRLLPDGNYTEATGDFDSQEALIKQAYINSSKAAIAESRKKGEEKRAIKNYVKNNTENAALKDTLIKQARKDYEETIIENEAEGKRNETQQLQDTQTQVTAPIQSKPVRKIGFLRRLFGIKK